MKPRFRWQTEDEREWPGEEETAVHPRHGRWLLWLVALGVAAAGIFLYAQQMRRLRLVEQTIKEDVLAVHATWLQAIATRDMELLSQLLSRDDIHWLTSQRRQLLKGVMLDHPALGLQAVGDPEVTAVEIAPDWQSAEIITTQRYAGQGGGSFSLSQSRSYIFDGSRWLQTPPDSGFWGDWQIFSGNRVGITFPSRDRESVYRLGRWLDADLNEACLLAANCPGTAHIELLFTTSPAVLTALRDEETPVFDGRAYLLPTPSLVGVPLDDAGYQALYAGYTRRILQTFHNQFDSPVPLPAQDLLTLCFPPGGPAANLFQYHTDADEWTAELPGRAFSSITSLPDDTGVILQERFAEGDPTRLYLLRWQSGRETPLFDVSGIRWIYPPVGWAGMAVDPFLLLKTAYTSPTESLYRRLDLDDCDASGCGITNLPGYTVWSPDGRRSLVLLGTALYLGDEAGQPQQALDAGFNPFWLDDEQFAYIRYVTSGRETRMELVQSAVDAESPPQPLLSPNELGEDVPPFFYYAAPHPTNPQQIFIAGPDQDSASSGYRIYSLAVDGTLELRLELENKPFGYPLLLTPTGYPPFLFSPDGRYLVLTELVGEAEKSWRFYLHDVSANETAVLSTSYPPYPARYPFYDWSADGRWLAIMDDGFVRLEAPDFGYERLITYEYDTCFFVNWVNQ